MPGPDARAGRNLVERQDLLIITNDFAIANLMIERGQWELIHTGGRLCRENQSTVGHLTAKNAGEPVYRCRVYFGVIMESARTVDAQRK